MHTQRKQQNVNLLLYIEGVMYYQMILNKVWQ